MVGFNEWNSYLYLEGFKEKEGEEFDCVDFVEQKKMIVENNLGKENVGGSRQVDTLPTSTRTA